MGIFSRHWGGFEDPNDHKRVPAGGASYPESPGDPPDHVMLIEVAVHPVWASVVGLFGAETATNQVKNGIESRTVNSKTRTAINSEKGYQ